jgi:hypothetical protein
MGPQEIFVVASLLLVVLFGPRRLAAAVGEGINNFWDNLGGGPRTPMHPSPADDGALLRRRARKIED